ncbi:hypothetical protein [Cerasicoccus fimbriatus]|uniref:hypothetical protein n=1 Tax=Cerasicoccus fimbriatus TaxID=3014554 RepID=UPI0022B3CA6B|nr:hypothetical protein [Cerasicoccus sp. TK19100]
MKYLLSLPIAGALLISHIHAADIVWDGGGDGTSWSDPINWDTDTVPTASDFFNPAGATITVSVTDATYSTLIAPSSGSVVIASGGILTGTGSDFRVIRYVNFTAQNGGEFHVPFDANIRSDVTIDDGGLFTGADHIQDAADLLVNGSWSPGDNVDGNNVITFQNASSIILGATGNITLDIFGNGVNEYFDLGTSTSTLDLSNGSITLLSQGYTPQLGDQFNLWYMPAGGTVIPGDGSNITLSGFTLDTSSFMTDGIVTVVPEPRAYAMVFALVVGLGVCLKRRS